MGWGIFWLVFHSEKENIIYGLSHRCMELAQDPILESGDYYRYMSEDSRLAPMYYNNVLAISIIF